MPLEEHAHDGDIKRSFSVVAHTKYRESGSASTLFFSSALCWSLDRPNCPDIFLRRRSSAMIHFAYRKLSNLCGRD